MESTDEYYIFSVVTSPNVSEGHGSSSSSPFALCALSHVDHSFERALDDVDNVKSMADYQGKLHLTLSDMLTFG
jgi:hypothetical protein